mgnify:CR=1 FL=1
MSYADDHAIIHLITFIMTKTGKKPRWIWSCFWGIFLAVYITFVAVAFNYARAFRVKNKIIDWIEQYYIPNTPGIIRPILICPKSNISQKTIDAFRTFNAKSNGRYQPLEYIEVTDNGTDLIFTNIPY